MTPDEARVKLRRLVRQREDARRFRRLVLALASCPEVQSSALAQASRFELEATRAADRLEGELVRALAGGSDGDRWLVPDSTGDPSAPAPAPDPLRTVPSPPR